MLVLVCERKICVPQSMAQQNYAKLIYTRGPLGSFLFHNKTRKQHFACINLAPPLGFTELVPYRRNSHIFTLTMFPVDNLI